MSRRHTSEEKKKIGKVLREGSDAERLEISRKYGVCLRCVNLWCHGCQASHCPKHCRGADRHAIRFDPVYNGDASFPLIRKHFPNDPLGTKKAYAKMAREVMKKKGRFIER